MMRTSDDLEPRHGTGEVPAAPADRSVLGGGSHPRPGVLRVLLADDHTVVREGTRDLLERDPAISVVGEAGDGPTAVELAARLAPDVVLLDLSLPVFTGVEAARRIASSPDHPHVLILSAHDEEAYVVAALEAGAHGYLLKTARADEVAAAIHAVARGEIVLHPGVAKHVIGRGDRGGDVPVLEPRELQILRHAAQGLRTRDIAAVLEVSPRTVEAGFTSIFGKLGVSSRTEAVMHAASRGWLSPHGGSAP